MRLIVHVRAKEYIYISLILRRNACISTTLDIVLDKNVVKHDLFDINYSGSALIRLRLRLRYNVCAVPWT